MKNKKIIMYISIMLLIILLTFLGWLVLKNNNQEKNAFYINEYIPQEEITDKQLRNTTISLYFYNPEENKIQEEVRSIDAKELLENPQEVLLKLLINGPEANSNLQEIMSKDTKINSIEINNRVLSIDFSPEIVSDENLKRITKEQIKEAIYKTVIQLNEFDNIIIKIDGQENII